MELLPEFQKFIEKHRNENPNTLRLRFHDKEPWIGDAICHIESLKKARHKFVLPDGTDLTPEFMPVPLSVEQATSATIGELHNQLASTAVTIVDMTCGLGIDALMLGRLNHRRIAAIEQNEKIASAARYNLRAYNNINVFHGDSIIWLQQNSSQWLKTVSSGNEKIDLIFIDPARRGKDGQRLYNIRDCQPNVVELLSLFRSKARRVMIKLSPMLDVKQTLTDLPDCTELHIVDESGECRELLAIVDFTDTIPEPSIIIHSNQSVFQFQLSAEHSANATYTIPHPGDYLFEPSPATMKGMPFNLLCCHFNIKKLHKNTHLYTSETPHSGFPGKTYRIEAMFPLASSRIKEIGKQIGQADVAIRNMPGLSPDELQKRMKIKSGGGKRIMATTLTDNSHTIFLLSKV